MVAFDLDAKVVGLDTAPFIYFFEDHPKHAAYLESLFERNQAGELLLVTSTVTLLEVLVLPLREKRRELVRSYRNALLGSKGIELLSVRADVAERAAELRAKYGIRSPDAIQVAAALCADADCFVTNDKQLKQIEELNIVILDEVIR